MLLAVLSRFNLHLPLSRALGRLLARFIGRIDHITDAAHGLNELLRPLIIDLTAQVPDIDIDDIGQTVVIHIPYMFDDHGTAERPALIAHHVFEDAKFFGRQLDWLAAASYFAANAIQRKVGNLQALGSRLAAAQQRTNAGEQLYKSERFDQVIVSALFQALDTIVERTAGAEDQDWRTDLAVTDF